MNKEFLRERTGRIEQLASVRRAVIDDGKGRGMRVIDVRNGSGLSFTVYPDKGLDIGPCEYCGVPLTWLAPNGPVAPAYYDAGGMEWLRSWAGGLMTTCGLINVGGPCETKEGEQGIHGRADNIPAEEVNTKCEWLDDGRYRMEISGTILHSRVFGEKLVTKRTIITYLGSSSIEVVDSVENQGYETMPFMLLYHMNLGWPFIDENAVIETADHETIPQNDFCRANIESWAYFSEPVANIQEQVFYHDLPADNDGNCIVRVVNHKRGLSASILFRKEELPYFIQWKMPGKGEYVLGIEPSNCYPEGQNSIAGRGLLRHINPGEVIETRVVFTVDNVNKQ